MDPTPASIGGYPIQSVLGTGGTSTVYLARHADHLVALKVFDSGRRWPPTLAHPNIVPVYASGETASGQRWTAMQYAPGGDADTELRAGRMPPDRAVRIIAAVAEALDFAHSHGVVHGDVKPSNFLLDDHDRALLADFGAPPFAEDGMVLTSAAYASPEMLRGADVDGRADVYSLGCALFRLLTGKPPFFDAASKAEVVDCHLHRPAPCVTTFAPWLPATIDAVVAKAMAKNPAERYRSARALAAEAAEALR
ncbi:serine/threonine-protein kinase [Mycobacterium sp. CVI_P3]|uniref:non-specific serine/threonine protein kinase n=1 Tax=Mycobacterium pinniadriaticum TaxID=2994102 RepID=A0ABT3SKE0_9MYCO|nr:serine/threonine-protein kinase [Mycobacterium pinniadriaticum]MCX2933438.1 serine/threonine-protein kinase [Mycobacterium pinniadriaticum]MCX2939923.1 serine/threonine-protein kinase [Mycobacterium pinniadriaticum]